MVATAARAPSVHNTQPWRFRIAGDIIELHADPDRILMQIDPAGRELMISCGAALFGLRLGLRQLGCVPTVELWPDPEQPWLVARAWPDGHAAVNSVEAELFGAVPAPAYAPRALHAGRGVAAIARGAGHGRDGRGERAEVRRAA